MTKITQALSHRGHLYRRLKRTLKHLAEPRLQTPLSRYYFRVVFVLPMAQINFVISQTTESGNQSGLTPATGSSIARGAALCPNRAESAGADYEDISLYENSGRVIPSPSPPGSQKDGESSDDSTKTTVRMNADFVARP